jgi:DNA-binding response OmpR family regulator
MEKNKVFIVDDDRDIVNLINDILTDEGYEVEKAYNAKEALEKINEDHFDLIIIDIMLPDIDGLEICRKIRDSIDVPIIFLTAKSKSIDKVIGLEIGADDYITKPFDDNELAARVKAHIRRQKRASANIGSSPSVKYDGIEINKNSYEVFVEGEKVELSTREFQILAYMMDNPNIVLTREQIYNNVWGYGDFGDINTVTVHIKKLREKVDKGDKFIKTIWGAGYKFIGKN